MARVAALIIADAGRFLGMDLTVRGALAASRAGVEQIFIAGEHPHAQAVMEQLGTHGIAVTWTPNATRPLRVPLAAETLVVLDAGMIVEPAGLKQLVRQAAGHPSAGLLVVDPEDSRLAGRFARRIDHARDIPRLEHEYLSQVSGGRREGFFTRQIRRWSIPISRRLLRIPVTANQVTLAGFALAVVAGLSFSIGGYWTGLTGACLYFFSTVLDCSDGEVARGGFSDSKYGAWLETITDYLSYFIVLGGIVWGDVRVEGFCIHAKAAIVAAAASLAIVLIVGYLRARIAGANPGALDDALAEELQKGTMLHRFTGWSRQLIKRSFFAHLVLFQAAIGFLPALTEIWAYGSVAALVLILAVQTHLIQRVRVDPIGSAALPMEN